MKVGIATDLLELRERYVKGGQYIRSGNISPTGVRAVFDFRGEIVTVPAEKGDARNLTQTPGAHEKFPSWSPDGKSIAYFSDASGEYELFIQSQDGKGTTRKIKLNGAGFYADIFWSPDSKKISYVDNGRTLYLMDVASGTSKKIDSDEMYFPGVFRQLHGDWSSDSKWIANNKVLESNYRQVFVYSVDQGKSYTNSDGLSDASEIVFDEG
jgi:tricorn protease